MGDIRNTYTILVGEPEGKNHSEDLGTDGGILLGRILEKYGGKLWTEWI
jgi:hypothetical protein